jgi:hypothetical protein
MWWECCLRGRIKNQRHNIHGARVCLSENTKAGYQNPEWWKTVLFKPTKVPVDLAYAWKTCWPRFTSRAAPASWWKTGLFGSTETRLSPRHVWRSFRPRTPRQSVPRAWCETGRPTSSLTKINFRDEMFGKAAGFKSRVYLFQNYGVSLDFPAWRKFP